MKNEPSTLPPINEDLGWLNLRKTEGSVIEEHIKPYINRELPDNLIVNGFADFIDEHRFHESIDIDLIGKNLFDPWFYFDWIPFDDFKTASFNPELTVAQNYLSHYSLLVFSSP